MRKMGMPKGEYLVEDQLGYAGVGEPGRSVKPLRMLSQFESDYLNVGCSSMVERLVVVQVMGVRFPSVTPGSLTQLVECYICNVKVGSSNLPRSTEGQTDWRRYLS